MKALCHCGNVKITFDEPVGSVTSCNCSICNRLGALWAYFEPAKVTVKFETSATKVYSHGDQCIDFHHCRICGCVTHYIPTLQGDPDRMAINFRMVSPNQLKNITVRYFDGAETWTFIE